MTVDDAAVLSDPPPAPIVEVLSEAEMALRIPAAADLHLTMQVRCRRRQISIAVSQCEGQLHPRPAFTIPYIVELHAAGVRQGLLDEHREHEFFFQSVDEAADVESVSWERPRSSSRVQLVPDLYFFEEHGYDTFLPEAPAWQERQDTVLWRGSTTGLVRVTPHNLEQLPRYKLVRAAASVPGTDIGFASVVQCADANDHDLLVERLTAEALMRPFMRVEAMANYRYIVDIGGNASAWNLVQRLRMGACILKVEGEWSQWLSERLVPWTHYVPVSADLSDLAERIDWCRSQPDRAEWIAAQARQLGLAMTFDREMLLAAETVFSPR